MLVLLPTTFLLRELEQAEAFALRMVEQAQEDYEQAFVRAQEARRAEKNVRTNRPPGTSVVATTLATLTTEQAIGEQNQAEKRVKSMQHALDHIRHAINVLEKGYENHV